MPDNPPTVIAAADIGGTHARFARVAIDRSIPAIVDEPLLLCTDDFSDLKEAWRAFCNHLPGEAPDNLAISFAGPVKDGRARLTNSDWDIAVEPLARDLGLDRALLLNDFVAVGHAAACLDADSVQAVLGSVESLGRASSISVVGPGTGLGVALVLRDRADYRVQASEGGHIGFAPVDAVDDALVARLRSQGLRSSAERVAAGPAIVDIYRTVADLDDCSAPLDDAVSIWSRGLDGSDDLARRAVDRFCAILGGVAGDLVLAHGSEALVLAGGVGLRLADRFKSGPFADRFHDKGRFSDFMRTIPAAVITHPYPGLVGVAAAFRKTLGPNTFI